MPLDPDLADVESAPVGRRWCKSADHHEWLHMLLDRSRAELMAMYRVIAEQGGPPASPGTVPPGDDAPA